MDPYEGRILYNHPRGQIIGGHTNDPFVIHPYYTGRDKGAIHGGDGQPLLFFREGDAWWHIFFVLQPGDDRAKHNYRVIRLSEYDEANSVRDIVIKNLRLARWSARGVWNSRDELGLDKNEIADACHNIEDSALDLLAKIDAVVE